MLVSIIIALIIIGILLYAINNFVSMDAKIKQILNFVIVVVVVLWLLFRLLPLAHLP